MWLIFFGFHLLDNKRGWLDGFCHWLRTGYLSRNFTPGYLSSTYRLIGRYLCGWYLCVHLSDIERGMAGRFWRWLLTGYHPVTSPLVTNHTTTFLGGWYSCVHLLDNQRGLAWWLLPVASDGLLSRNFTPVHQSSNYRSIGRFLYRWYLCVHL